MKEGEWCDAWMIHAFCTFISLLYMNSDCLPVLFLLLHTLQLYYNC